MEQLLRVSFLVSKPGAGAGVAGSVAGAARCIAEAGGPPLGAALSGRSWWAASPVLGSWAAGPAPPATSWKAG